MLDPNRPIYRDAPLRLVTFQIQFPHVPDLDDTNPRRELAEALRERYPILGPPPVVQVELGPGAPQQQVRGARFTNRERTSTITLTSEAVAVETSRYQRYERFAEEISWALDQVHAVTPLPAVTRLGLRYIDEIEMPDVDELADWRPWIHEDLLVGGLIDGYRTREYLATALLEVDELRRITVRYGRVSQPVVNPAGTLRIDQSPSGPYFLLDIDSFWEPSRDKFLEFNANEVQEVCLALHEPIRDIFERAITPALRKHFSPEVSG